MKNVSQWDRLAPGTKNYIGSGKGLILPSRFCLKGKKSSATSFFFFSLSPFFLKVCEQLSQGIVYPLAAKSAQVLDIAHQKERVALV